jgi:dTDP-4-dehydrorhamnose 3,5-epimerase
LFPAQSSLKLLVVAIVLGRINHVVLTSRVRLGPYWLASASFVVCLISNQNPPMPPETEALVLPEVLLVRPDVFKDDRGFFVEAWNERDFDDAVGYSVRFVQDNHSRSSRFVLRGIHYQINQAQGKLVRVVAGRVFDVVVDLRRSSPMFGRWAGAVLSEEQADQLWIPPGFGHGFLVLSESADVMYKATDYYDAASDRSIRWDDPDIGIAWPLEGAKPIVSTKDEAAPRLADAEVFA